MPLKTYKCGCCSEKFEVLIGIKDLDPICPKCECPRVERVFEPGSTFGFQFKCTGATPKFYKDHNRK